ncbi:hypothetical protein GOV09_03095 [Candidatus Woesearchaeota archaeon]|nr:hypothetical protein [Candidatus Woesearchaeota archaeon]
MENERESHDKILEDPDDQVDDDGMSSAEAGFQKGAEQDEKSDEEDEVV